MVLVSGCDSYSRFFIQLSMSRSGDIAEKRKAAGLSQAQGPATASQS
jgi:hypothetical protein